MVRKKVRGLYGSKRTGQRKRVNKEKSCVKVWG
jgi:hypothetical protein